MIVVTNIFIFTSITYIIVKFLATYINYRTECYDYLFEMAVEMKKLGLDPCLNPETAKTG